MTKSKPTAGSGSGLREKGDNHLPLFVVEDKTTSVLSYQLRQHVLAALEQAARKEGKWPALALHFIRPSGIVNQDWVMMPASIAAILLKAVCLEVTEELAPLYLPDNTKIMRSTSGKATIDYRGGHVPQPRKR